MGIVEIQTASQPIRRVHCGTLVAAHGYIEPTDILHSYEKGAMLVNFGVASFQGHRAMVASEFFISHDPDQQPPSVLRPCRGATSHGVPPEDVQKG